MHLYTRVLKLVAPYWRRIALGMLAMVGVAACTAASAYLIKPVLDDIFINKQIAMLKYLSLLVLFICMFKAVCLCLNAYLMSEVGQRIITSLRQQLYDHIQNLPLLYFDRTSTGNLMSRTLNDVNMVQGALSDTVSGAIKESFSIIGLVFVIFYRDWQLAAIGIMVVPIAFLPIFKFGKMIRRITGKTQKTIGDLSVVLHETISGNRIVKAFGMEDYEKERFRSENERIYKYTVKSVVVRAYNSSVMEFLGGLGVVFIIWYGGYKVITSADSPGNFFSFIAALLMLYDPVKRISNIYASVQQGLAAAARVYEVLDTPVENTAEPDAIELPQIRSEIAFRNVSFRYDDNPVLTDINFRIGVGQIVAIVGMSGSGKSTLVNLIPRFYEVSGGSILIDGVDIRKASLRSLRSRIALVTQQTILFNDTVRNNIAYGDIRRTDEEIIAAAKAANAYDFIMKMPEGFDTMIGEQGARLSGGERQRICIARALLKDAPILILDEATSSLDSDSELEVQKALENLMAGRTTLIIAHRLSTIQNADRIITMVKGKIVEEGRHDELMQFDSEYRRLYELQFAQYDGLQEKAQTAASRS